MARTATLLRTDDALSSNIVPKSPRGKLEGKAFIYKLSEPVDLDGDGIADEYVLVRILYRRKAMHAEISLFPCNEEGVFRGDSVMRRMGSFPLVPCPEGNPDAISFAIGVAFKFYDIEVK